jgi:hypothetical protein
MRRISPRLLPNTVEIQLQAAWSFDAAGGRVPNPGGSSDPIRCSVQPTDARDVPEHLRETALTYSTVYFADDPGVNVRDAITWTDPVPPRLLTVLGKRQDRTGLGNTWVVLCAERT